MSNSNLEYKTKTINSWLTGSQEALDTAKDLHKAKRYSICLFCCHLCLEKAIKALYLHKTDSIPPFIHDLDKLLEKIKIILNQEQKQDFVELTSFCIKARYDDIKQDLYKKANEQYTNQWLQKTIAYHLWIKTHF